MKDKINRKYYKYYTSKNSDFSSLKSIMGDMIWRLDLESQKLEYKRKGEVDVWAACYYSMEQVKKYATHTGEISTREISIEELALIM